MAMHTNERELLQLEREFWDALQAKDARRAERLTDDHCIVVGAQGVASIDPPAMARMTEDASWEIDEYDFDEDNAEIKFLGQDVAILAYRVDERVTVDGETIPLKAHDSSVWVRKNGEWRCALHTESLEGDPYGRDRRA